MQGRQFAKRVENLNDAFIDARGSGKPIAAMHNAMPDGVDGAQPRLRTEPLDDGADGLLMILRRDLFLSRRAALNKKGARCLAADSIN